MKIKIISNRYTFSGKEKQTIKDLGWLDFTARMLSNSEIPMFTTQDPLSEKYYSVSPYVYCAGNPIKFVDPNGMDVWEINNQGEIINRIKDKTQDAFYMVAKNADGKYQRTFATDSEGNKTYNSIAFEYGTISDSKSANLFRDATSFSVTGESAGAELFKFFADNTKVEFGLINTQNDGSTIMTNHKEGVVNPWSFIKNYKKNGETITSFTHNHPSNSDPSGFGKNSTSGDKFFVESMTNYLGYSPVNYVYQTDKNSLVMYNNTTQVIKRTPWGMIFAPSNSKIQPVPSARRFYPGVGLPPY
jgi:RHS repeat-associated protein